MLFILVTQVEYMHIAEENILWQAKKLAVEQWAVLCRWHEKGRTARVDKEQKQEEEGEIGKVGRDANKNSVMLYLWNTKIKSISFYSKLMKVNLKIKQYKSYTSLKLISISV